MKKSELLNASADRIQVDGWAQGGCGLSNEGGKCIINALAWTGEHKPSVWMPAADAVSKHLGVPSLQGWNDAPERTAEDVVAALRATAAVEELREAEARGPLHTTGPTVRVPTQPGVGVA